LLYLVRYVVNKVEKSTISDVQKVLKIAFHDAECSWGQVAGDLYRPSDRRYRGLEKLDYPFHDMTITVTTCGRICYNRRKVNFSTIFAGQNIGIKEIEDRIWIVSFMDYDLGYFDHETCRLEPLENPFELKVSPMSQE